MNLKISASLRVKRRYLLIKSSKDKVEKTILDYIGILGWAKASPIFVKHDRPGECILSVDRGAINDIRASFAIDAGNIQVARVSGTLKGLRVKQ
jgi:RNase P/RNase MRP subunit POP5